MNDEKKTTNNQTGGRKKSWLGRLADALKQDNVAGDAHVSAAAIIITLLFLMLLTAAMLYSITVRWPACDLPEEAINSNQGGDGGNTNTASTANSNASGARNANANTNVNTTASANSNTGVSTNTNVNANIAANTNTTANANAVAPAGTATPANNNTATPPGQTAAGGGIAAGATIDANTVEPKSGPVTGKTLVVVKGKNFGTSAEGLKVKFDGVEARISAVSNESISVRTPPHSEGAVDVSVEKGGASDVLPSEFVYTCPAPTGTNLFLMLIFAGALGGCIHAMRSLFWYVGQRELRWSWMPMYFALPFIGAAMAMLFGLLIFAGLFDNTTGRSESLFIIAVAGLVGMFSQQASLKLTDIANAIFTKPGTGKDAEPQKSVSVGAGEQNGAAALTATEMDKTEGSTAGKEEVTIKGTGFSEATTVNFGDDAAEVKAVTQTSLTVLTPAHAAGPVEVKVKSGDSIKTLPDKYTYIAPTDNEGEG
ncbi:MAG TPA: IPT/TIG domain-containing protein [Pyrinomonadaceae bacterium]|nr:IPT/TIG domain-containing protein [Pyrinomonadaceae bacterium]